METICTAHDNSSLRMESIEQLLITLRALEPSQAVCVLGSRLAQRIRLDTPLSVSELVLAAERMGIDEPERMFRKSSL